MNINWRELVAFFPVYTGEGLVTQLVYGDHSQHIPVSVGAIVVRACRHFCLDPRSLRNAAHFVSGRRNLTPLPLALDMTFVALKVHAPVVEGDAAYGYFRLQALARFESRKGGSTLHLSNNVTIELCLAENTALAHAARAQLFERAFWSRRLGATVFAP